RRRRGGLRRFDVQRRHPAVARVRLPPGRRPPRRDHRAPRPAQRRRRGTLPDPGPGLRGRRPAGRRPRLPPDALCQQRPAPARHGRQGRRNRSGTHAHQRAARGSAPGGDRAAALPARPTAAGAGVRAAGGAAGTQFAAADALRPGDARLPGLHGRHQPDVDGHRLAGQGQAAAGAGPVVVAAAAAGVRGLGLPARRPHAPAADRARGQGERVMAPFPKIHVLYVSRMVVMTVLLTWTVLVGLDVVNAMIGEFSDVGKGSYGLLEAVTYIVYTIPRRAYTMSPTLAVSGAPMALAPLA